MTALELVIPLARPITKAGRSVSEITLSEPTAGQVRHCERLLRTPTPYGNYLDAEVRAYQIELVGRVSGIGDEIAGDLPVSKLDKAAAWLHEQFIVSKRPKDWVADTESDQLVIDLPAAIKVAEISYDQLILREPTSGEVKKAESSLRANWGAEDKRRHDLWLVAYAAGIPYPAVEAMPISIVVKAYEWLENFTVASRRIGGS